MRADSVSRGQDPTTRNPRVKVDEQWLIRRETLEAMLSAVTCPRVHRQEGGLWSAPHPPGAIDHEHHRSGATHERTHPGDEAQEPKP